MDAFQGYLTGKYMFQINNKNKTQDNIYRRRSFIVDFEHVAAHKKSNISERF